METYAEQGDMMWAGAGRRQAALMGRRRTGEPRWQRERNKPQRVAMVTIKVKPLRQPALFNNNLIIPLSSL